MLGIPMLGMVGAKTAIVKKIDKNARGKMQEAAPAVLKALGGIPRLQNEDRSDTMMPMQSMEARVTGGFPRATPRYNDAAKSGLFKKIPEDSNVNDFPTDVQKTMGYTKDAEGNPITRHMKFCGGGSKPYKKK